MFYYIIRNRNVDIYVRTAPCLYQTAVALFHFEHTFLRHQSNTLRSPYPDFLYQRKQIGYQHVVFLHTACLNRRFACSGVNVLIFISVVYLLNLFFTV